MLLARTDLLRWTHLLVGDCVLFTLLAPVAPGFAVCAPSRGFGSAEAHYTQLSALELDDKAVHAVVCNPMCPRRAYAAKAPL